MGRFGPAMGAYAVVPLWLVELDVSHAAVRVFALLAAKYADANNRAFPSRGTLGRDLGVSRDTIDRALAELIDARVIVAERRKSKTGNYTSNLYLLRFEPEGGRKSAPTATLRPGGRKSAATMAAPMPQQEPDVQEPDLQNEKERARALPPDLDFLDDIGFVMDCVFSHL